MQNKLLKASLIISFVGIFLLLFLTTLKPKEVGNYNELELNERVKTQGKIIEIKNYDNFFIISLDNNITITCNSCQLKENQTIEAEGKVTDYKKQLQINAEKIQIKNVA